MVQSPTTTKHPKRISARPSRHHKHLRRPLLTASVGFLKHRHPDRRKRARAVIGRPEASHPSLVVKLVAQLNAHHTRITYMRTAKTVGEINKVPLICQIRR